jgi:hypothetical protein
MSAKRIIITGLRKRTFDDPTTPLAQFAKRLAG